MTDTGQVPGEGQPENAGMVEQPGVAAPGAYTYLSETPAEDEDLLLPGAQGAWGNEVPPPAPEPVVEAVHEPGPHELGGRDSGSVDLGGVRLPNHTPPTAPTTPIPPITPRRPLHLGPPIPDASASPVRSLADRGPAGAPVRQPGPATTGPEYLDAPQVAAPQVAAPWGAQAPAPAAPEAAPESAPVEAAAPAAPLPEPADAAQATMARLATQAAVPPAQEAAAPATAPEAAHLPGTGTQVPDTAPHAEAPEAAEGAAPPAADGSQPATDPTAGTPAVAAPAGDAGAASAVAPVAEAGGEDPAAAPVADAAAEAPAAVAEDAAEAPAPAAVADDAGQVPAEAGADQAAAATPVPADTDQAPAAAPLPAEAPQGADAVPAEQALAAAEGDVPVEQTAPVAEGDVPAEQPLVAAEGAVPAVEAEQPLPQPAEPVQPQPAEPVQGPVAVPVQDQGPDAPSEAAPAPESVPAPEATPAPEAAQETAAPERQAAPEAPGAPETAAPAAVQTPEAPETAGTAGTETHQAPAQAVAEQAPVTADEPFAPEATPQVHEGQEAPEAVVPGAAQAPQPVTPEAAPTPEPTATETSETSETSEVPEAAEAVAPVAPAPQAPTAALAAEAVPTPAPQPADAAPQPAPEQPTPAGAADVTAGSAAPAPDDRPAAHPEAPATEEPATEAPAPAAEAPATDPAPDVPVAGVPVAAAPPAEAPAPGPQPVPDSAPAPAEDGPAPQQPLGRLVPVDGTVPGAPTPPHGAVAVPDGQAAVPPQPQPQPAVTVPAPREAEPVPAPAAAEADAALVQQADDLDTRGAGQEDQEAEGTAPVAEARQSTGPAAPAYDDAEREAVLKVMRERRDIRNGFRSDPIPHEVLLRVLEAAHTAPSVGHSQPWDFVVIRSAETRRTMHELAMRQREAYAKSLPKGRAKQFKELKIEAILDTPVNIVVTADPTRGGRHTLGRHTQPQMAPYSAALAVENLWLAARAEGLGVGWVSFFDEREMVRALDLPEHLEVIAYLCVGYVDEFPDEPELMQAGWSKRRPLSWVVHEETYGRRALPGEEPHDLLAETVAQIRPLDAKALGEAWERQKRMTKPAGALGMLEIISAQLAGLSRQCPPPIPEPAAVAIFAGDHGVHAQGVTPWPQEVTAQMVANFLGGGAVCNAFANQVGAEVCIVDVGVAADLPATPGLLPRKVRPGTADMTTGPALTREEVKQAIEVGIETARDLVAAGNKALLTGEMGIANTTASAALISVFTGTDPAEVTGRGTGINDETLARKTEVVRRAIELHQPDPADPIGVLAAIGGLEHAAMVGLLLGGASLRTPVILDGVSAGAAALVARAIAPEVLAACIAGHRSAEPGHVAALNKLGLRPLVDLDLRLGEGTGALLALPMVQSTARAMHEVATFDSAGVTEK
ncbi:nicotinate-nucleotide--dimethylbenzimidazole phosphoribosyltransferase [Streptomyces glaucescens]|uniref:Nicotinate-nucleotide--dimethylbenzimidazole phosphoribosyltransferase n=1 Tax=Streptomyces glaucescens TaxID=1907 RepID=A0A089X2I3_STRGA|nr:nicotinate-nucleotide--dimethylbenzimidazole phosphoribosyltransferase [Streptomyces glaucescens]AIR97288.1 nicotinate-nucleotide-dimethylbenzimidazole phosphoribosyltransferase [Streptomyces glaucescens]